MATLLSRAAAGGIMPAFVGELLAAFAAEPQGMDATPPPAAPPAASPLIEPLSQRELEILRLFATELSGPEIAQALVIALRTLRIHTKSIYGKLNVSRRRAAVKRAAELGLL